MAAGGAAGLCQTVITTPMELLKIQLQLSAQQNAGRKASALLLASQLISTQGEKFLFIFLPTFISILTTSVIISKNSCCIFMAFELLYYCYSHLLISNFVFSQM